MQQAIQESILTAKEGPQDVDLDNTIFESKIMGTIQDMQDMVRFD